MIEEATQKQVDSVIRSLGAKLGSVEIAPVDELNKGQGFVWSLTKDSKTIAVGGVRELWPGTGEAWLLATKDICNVPIEISKALRGALNRADENGFIRVQCVVHVQFIESQRWVEKAGFEEVTLSFIC